VLVSCSLGVRNPKYNVCYKGRRILLPRYSIRQFPESRLTAAIQIMDNADNNRSKGESGEKINANIVHAFASANI
jgi:hypothetical protein